MTVSGGGLDPVNALVSALRELRRQAGEPSARAIAKQIGDVSHTTVSEALVGRRIPSWPILASVVRQLGGDQNRFRDLWSAATDETPTPGDIERSDLKFLIRYRRRVAQQHRFLSATDLGFGSRIEIAGLYVPRRIVIVDRNGDPGPSETIDFLQPDTDISRAVVLAGPGGGKSTLCEMLAYHYAITEELPVPFLVPVRDFAAEMPLPRSVVGFIEHRLETVYQAPPPDGFVARQLDAGNALVLFDGLDEVHLPSHRALVASVIELLADDYPRSRILVTSRTVGYEQHRLDPARFTVFSIAEFDHADVGRFARSWFGQAEDLPERAAEQVASRFLEESASVGKLRSNPLLLTLLCQLYQRSGHLPRNRSELYQAYWQSMLDRDASRGVKVARHTPELDTSMLGYLAVWVLSHSGDGWTIPQTTLLRVIASFLVERMADSDDAEAVARQKLDFLLRRTGAITGVGQTARGDEVYSFTHRTFMEYFAANYLARTLHPGQVARELAPWLGRPEWVNVAKLAVQIADRLMAGGAEHIIHSLTTEIQSLPAHQRDVALDRIQEIEDAVDLSSPVVNGPSRQPDMSTPGFRRGNRIPSAGPASRDIFVIHGRDESVREPFFEFLRAVDLRPMEWEAIVADTGRASPSLLDVVETALARAGAVVALLTPDDIVQLHPTLHEAGEPVVETKQSLQPRPNVLVELGMALGACRDRTIVVEIGDLRPVADLTGINVIRFDGTEVTLGKLVQRLRSAGCPVDAGGNDWRSKRRFASLEALSRKPV